MKKIMVYQRDFAFHASTFKIWHIFGHNVKNNIVFQSYFMRSTNLFLRSIKSILCMHKYSSRVRPVPSLRVGGQSATNLAGVCYLLKYYYVRPPNGIQ